MELISVRDLFKHTEDYAGKTVTVGGWVRSIRASKQFGFIVLVTARSLTPCRWFIMTIWKISSRYPRPMWALP